MQHVLISKANFIKTPCGSFLRIIFIISFYISYKGSLNRHTKHIICKIVISFFKKRKEKGHRYKNYNPIAII